MSGAKVEVGFGVKGSENVEAAWQRQERLILKNTESLRGHSAETSRQVKVLRARRDAAAEDARANKEAAAIAEQTKTAQQRYLEQIQRLKQHLAENRLTTDQYRLAVGALQQQYLKDSGIAAKRAAEQQAAAEQQKKAAATESAAKLEANRITVASMTAQERYAARVQELSGHLQAGRISQEIFNRSVAAAKAELDQATGATARLKTAEQNRANAQREGAAVTRSTMTAQERYLEEVKKLQSLLAQGVITEEAYRRKRQELQQAVRDATGATARENAVRAEAKQIIESTITPLERYRQTMAALTGHLHAGRINQAQFNAAATHARATLDQADSAAKRLSAQRFDGVASSIRTIGGVILGGGVLAGLNRMIEANNVLIRQGGELETKYAELAKKFQIQSGFTGADAENANNRVLDIAEVRRAKTADAFAGATELVSQGFDRNEVLDGALSELLQGLRATNLVSKTGDVDARQYAQAVSGYLRSQGKELNTENLRTVLQEIHALFKGTSLQLSDLTDFAKVTSIARGKASMEEQLAVFSQLKDVLGSSGEASTAFRQIVGRLQTAAASDTKVDSLAKIGLKPADVDLVGESLVEALERIDAGLAKIPVEERAVVLQKLFEEQGVAAFGAISGQDEAGNQITTTLKERTELAKKAASERNEVYAADVAIGESGPDSAANVLDVQIERALARRGGADVSLTRKALQKVLLDHDVVGQSMEAALTVFDKEIGLGAGRVGAAGDALNAAGLIDPETVDEVIRRVELAKGAVVAGGPLDQLPNLGSDVRGQRDADVLNREGFLPSQRFDRARRIAAPLADAVAQASPDGSAGGMTTRNGIPVSRFQAGLDEIYDRRDKLPSGEIEAEFAGLLRRVLLPAAGTEQVQEQVRTAIAQLEQLAEERRAQPALPAAPAELPAPSPAAPELTGPAPRPVTVPAPQAEPAVAVGRAAPAEHRAPVTPAVPDPSPASVPPQTPATSPTAPELAGPAPRPVTVPAPQAEPAAGRAAPAEHPAPVTAAAPSAQSDAEWQAQWEAKQRESQQRELVVFNARQELGQIDDPQRREYLQQQLEQRLQNRGDRAPDEVASEFMRTIQPPATGGNETAGETVPAATAKPEGVQSAGVTITMPRELTDVLRSLSGTLEQMKTEQARLMHQQNQQLASLNRPPRQRVPVARANTATAPWAAAWGAGRAMS